MSGILILFVFWLSTAPRTANKTVEATAGKFLVEVGVLRAVPHLCVRGTESDLVPCPADSAVVASTDAEWVLSVRAIHRDHRAVSVSRFRPAGRARWYRRDRRSP
jgi:hypothetical protein